MNLDGIKQKLISFFRQTKSIAGLAIMDNGLYFTAFSGDKKRAVLRKKIVFPDLTQENISKGLKKIRAEFGADFSSAVVSLPPADSYLSLFEFPLITEDEQIKEAMNLALSTLPIPEADIYSDWMPLENLKTKKKETVLAMVKKSAVDFYLKIFEENKISSIAVETYVWSLGQFLDEGDDIAMIIMEQFDSVIFAIYDGKIPYFQFSLPKFIFDNEEAFLKSAVHFSKRFIHFVSSENDRTREIKSIIVISDDGLKNYIQKNIVGVNFKELKNDSGIVGDFIAHLGFFAALGAAKRGLVPRRTDTIISLMPIGTELAYERHRLFSFVDFFQKFSGGFAGFLIVLFLGTLIMVKSLSSGIEKNLQKETSFPVEMAAAREKAKFFNEKISQISKINSTRPVWDKVFSEIDKYAGIGITINQISADKKGDVSFLGVATSRDALILLKNQIGGSAVFEFEPLPLSLFLNKENINFTIKGRLKNLKFLYQNG